MATVTHQIALPDGTVPPALGVSIRLVAAGGSGVGPAYLAATGEAIEGDLHFSATDGTWSKDLAQNADITPAGTVWRVTEHVGGQSYTLHARVTGNGDLSSMLVDPPAALATPASQAYTDAQLAAHVAAVDPHGARAYADSRRPLPSAAWQLLTEIQRDQRDAAILVVGDSTGDTFTEWVALTATWLDTAYPTHAVTIRWWDDTAKAYGSAENWGTGTGSHTIAIRNASAAGFRTTIWQSGTGSRWANAIRDVGAVDLIIVSLGHNEEADLSLFRQNYTSFLAELQAAHPEAGIACVAQNPAQIGDDNRARAGVIAEVCQARGFGFVDVQAAFLAHSPMSELYADNVHPNALGEALWRDTVTPYLTAARATRLTTGHPSPPALVQPPDPWLDVPLVAASWTAANVAVTADADRTESGWHSARLAETSAVAASTITSGQVPSWRALLGQWVTVAVRMWIPSALPWSDTLGLVTVDYGTGTATSVAAPAGKPVDAWFWQLVTFQLPATATGLAVQIAVDSAAPDGTKYLWVDRVTISRGRWPGELALDARPFTPAQLAPHSWFEPRQSKPGAALPDLLGGPAATLAAAPAAPAWADGVITFDGVDDYVTLDTASLPSMGAGDRWTVVMIARQNGVPNSYGRWFESRQAGAGPVPGVALQANDTSFQLLAQASDGVSSPAPFPVIGTFTDGAVSLLAVWRDATTIGARVNLNASYSESAAGLGATAGGYPTIGSWQGVSNFQAFDLIALLTFARALSLDELARLYSHYTAPT